MTIKGAVYLIGVLALGLGYGFLKSALSDWQLIAVAMVYLVVLRIIAELVDRKE